MVNDGSAFTELGSKGTNPKDETVVMVGDQAVNLSEIYQSIDLLRRIAPETIHSQVVNRILTSVEQLIPAQGPQWSQKEKSDNSPTSSNPIFEASRIDKENWVVAINFIHFNSDQKELTSQDFEYHITTEEYHSIVDRVFTKFFLELEQQACHYSASKLSKLNTLQLPTMRKILLNCKDSFAAYEI